MDDITREQCGRLLRLWLRHKPEQAGLTLEGDGWAEMDDVVAALARAEVFVDREDVAWLVRSEPEHAFEVEGGRIRARAGHSVDIGTPPHSGAPPATLYGAVPPRYADRTDITGLAPRKRRFLRLFTDRDDARASEMRRGQQPALYRVAAQEAHAEGLRFYPRGKGVWLSDPLPARFLTRLAPSTEPVGAPRAQPDPGVDTRRRRPRGGFMKPRDRKQPGERAQ